MFKVISEGSVRTFTHDVRVLMPTDDGHTEETLRTVFAYLDSDEVSTFNLATQQGTSDFLEKAVKTFTHLVDDDGQAVACTPELRAKLLKNSSIRLALSTHYFSAVTKVPEGN
ncbi:hypothetical protein [Bradyrhizobium sp. SZCCHNRI1058]|uniref:hypothetical protein n=1 Tax=Bradyrhizobium sp. SZCCHNRI1058 TaxID=3057279 RepID=UPI0029167875|nr:hypothetical protein [Bradyrhizobium sp. SZCCHNRI1058]